MSTTAPPASPPSEDPTAPPPLTPLETVRRDLELQLRVNQQSYARLDAYYRGVHPHTFDSMRFQQAFGSQLRSFADNWMRLVISATASRLTIQGFRVGDEADDTSSLDAMAWRIWKHNQLQSGSGVAHREAMRLGTCFLLVDPTTTPLPRITVETPFQVVGQRDAADRCRLINAIKKWVGNDGYLYLNMYLPEVVLKYRSVAQAQTILPNDAGRVMQQASWVQIDEILNPLGKVPIVPMENAPDLLTGGVSDLEDLIPLNDALNKLLRDMLVASEYQSFRQRWVVGADVPKDPETGKPLTQKLAQLTATERSVWMFPDANTKLGEFGQVDLAQYTNAIDMLVHHISMVSRTPSYMLVGKIANLSADAIRASELGFVGKLQTKQDDFGVPWERAARLALEALGDQLDGVPVEPIWADAFANSGSILSNELVQMGSLGVPLQVLFEKWGATPQEVERWMALRKQPGEIVSSPGPSGVQVAPNPDPGAPDASA